jgi:hypothetical protein
MPGSGGIEQLRGLRLFKRNLRRNCDPARRGQVVRVAAVSQLQVVMLDGVRQAQPPAELIVSAASARTTALAACQAYVRVVSESKRMRPNSEVAKSK